MPAPSAKEIQYQLQHIDDDKSTQLIVANVITISAASTAVVLRLISRRINKAPLKTDDFTIIAGLFFSAAYVAGQLHAVPLGLGRHFVLARNPTAFSQIIIANSITYLTALTTIKLSVLLLYRRLFPVPRFRQWLWCIASYILCWQIYQTFSTIFACTPVRGAWDHTITARCRDQRGEIIAAAVQNVVTDTLVLCSPIPMLWRLQMAKERKIQLSGLFALGGLVCIISIIRIPQVLEVSHVDPSWSDVGISLWSAAEVGAAGVSACLPVLRPIYIWIVYGRSSLEFSRIPSNTAAPNSSRRSKRRLFTFWLTPTSPDDSNGTSKSPHVIPTLNSSNGVDGNRWAERPISRIMSIYNRNKSRESGGTVFTDLEMANRTSICTRPSQHEGALGRSYQLTAKRKLGPSLQ